MVVCYICGKEYEQLSFSHLSKRHWITSKEYRRLFPTAEFFSESQKDLRRVSRSSIFKGFSYEEIYGKEKAEELREFHKNFHGSSGPCAKFVVCEVCGEAVYLRGLYKHKKMHEDQKAFQKKLVKCLVCNDEFDLNTIKRKTPICDLCWNNTDINDQYILYRKYTCSDDNVRVNMSKAKIKSLMEHPESHPNRILAGSGKSKDNPSYPQRILCDIVNKEYLAELNYPVNTGKTVRYVDVAVVDKKFGFEYDGEYFHDDRNKDIARDLELSTVGWIVFHIRGWDEIDFVRDNLKKIVEGGESHGVDAAPLVASGVKL